MGTFGSDNYVVAWYASSSEGKYAAQTLSGKGVNLKPCAFSTQGSHLVTAEVYSPFDTEMANPLLSADVGFEIDPGCKALRFEEFKLPARSEGSSEDLIVRLQLVDPNGNTILNEAGERPPHKG